MRMMLAIQCNSLDQADALEAALNVKWAIDREEGTKEIKIEFDQHPTASEFYRQIRELTESFRKAHL